MAGVCVCVCVCGASAVWALAVFPGLSWRAQVLVEFLYVTGRPQSLRELQLHLSQATAAYTAEALPCLRQLRSLRA